MIIQKDTPEAPAALIVEGGALRGVFSAGVLDGFLREEFDPFDFYLGVSSGASNLAAFLARMPGRNARIYMDHSLRPAFMNPARFLRGGHLLDLDWLWEVTIREMRLDLKRIYGRGKPFFVVMTDVRAGCAVYRETGPGDLEAVLKASSALPVLYRGFPRIDGRAMADGGLTDAVPAAEAIRRGARRLVVIRSRTRNYVKRGGLSQALMAWCLRGCPALARAVARRAERYNRSVSLLRNPPPGVSVAEVNPPASFRVSRLTRDRDLLQEGYQMGLAAAKDLLTAGEAAFTRG